jgi:hypothetical protein
VEVASAATTRRRSFFCWTSVFPVVGDAVLSLIELLARSACHQLHRMRDDVPVATIRNKQVDMV